VERLGPGNFGVGTWIERRARSAPDRPALITADGEQTYAALAERIRRLAGAFRRMGVLHGDRIAWLGENHPAFLEALFAAGRIGAVLAPVNHYLAGDERAVVVADADPVVVLEHAALPETPVRGIGPVSDRRGWDPRWRAGIRIADRGIDGCPCRRGG
jgi:fatty-acyl-CoA synthase